MTRGVVVAGRALHPPWNEGTRVIGRGVATLAARDRPVRTVSLTSAEHLDARDPALVGSTVRYRGAYGVAGDYRTLVPATRAILAAAREVDAAAVHVLGLPLAVAPAMRSRGLRTVVHLTLLEHASATLVDRARMLAAGRAFRGAVDAYAASATTIADGLMASGVPRSRIHLVGPPIDPVAFARADRAAARAALEMDADAFTVVYVGSISPARFPADQVAAALVAAGAEAPDLALEVLAPLATHPYNREHAETNVRRAADAAGIRARVRLRDLGLDEKALAYSAADVVILPFTAPVAVEPPLTLLEAMACEAPVIASPHANRARIVEDGATGRIAAAGAPLGEALLDLVRLGAAGRSALGRAARASALASHGEEAVLDQLRAVWDAIGV